MKYCIAFLILGTYLLLLSSFVSSDVQGGVKGGAPIATEQVGRTIVTLFRYGEQVVFGANELNGQLIRLLSFASLGVGILLGIIPVAKKRVSIRDLIGAVLGACFVGLLIGGITGMPVALVLKGVPAGSSWIYIGVLSVVAFLIFLFIGSKLSRDFD